ncbi:MAG: murein L,D-transpeptidase catalytic domain family protein [Bacteroidia bacterium]
MLKKVLFSLVVIALVMFGVKYIWFNNSEQYTKNTAEDCEAQKISSFDKHLQDVYKQAKLDSAGLDFEIYKKGMIGFYNLERESQINKPILSIVDFQKPSTEERLWVFDVKARKLLYHSLVAHGRNTGENTAVDFSNLANSNKSSIGFYVTQNLYTGKHGLSLVIDGMEKGWNDSAKSRSIVIHGADYVSEDFVEDVGRLGRSQGCPAVPQAICNGLVCTICDRSVMFIYYPDEKYLSQSEYLKLEPAMDSYALNNYFRCTQYTAMVLRSR